MLKKNIKGLDKTRRRSQPAGQEASGKSSDINQQSRLLKKGSHEAFADISLRVSGEFIKLKACRKYNPNISE